MRPKQLPTAVWRGCKLGMAAAWAALSLIAFSQSNPRQQGAGFRFHELSVPGGGKAGFHSIGPAQTGVRFTNSLSPDLLGRFANTINGSGVAAGDVDGDGLCDLYFGGLEGGNRLYRNLGNFKFEDITEGSGLACTNLITRGVCFADIDGDGDLDVLITTLGQGVRCFLNDGKGHFTDATEAWGLGGKSGSMTMALGDLDGDGTLDLFVSNFGVVSPLRDGVQFATTTVNGQPVVTGRWARRIKIIDGSVIEFGEPPFVFFNQGGTRFKAIPWEEKHFLDEQGNPVDAPWDFGLSAQIRDINGDGLPDIYVCNDFQTPDRVWINQGRGIFKALSQTAMRKASFASMGVDFADLERTGALDFFVAEMRSRDHGHRFRVGATDSGYLNLGQPYLDRPQTARNTLFHQRPDGTYSEVALFAGVQASEWSWQPVFLDVDLDGYEDLLVSNGHLLDMDDLDAHERSKQSAVPERGQKMVYNFPKYDSIMAAFRNSGGLRFEDAATDWGFTTRQISLGVALADLDNDGDLDVVVSCLNAPPLIYRNETSAPRVGVRLKGAGKNTQGIGAKVKLLGGAVPMQSQEIICGGRYLSGDDPMRTFAAGTTNNSMRIEVTWRSGKRSVIEGVRANRVYEVDEAGAGTEVKVAKAVDKPLFEDASALINHLHAETLFNDFDKQGLLPRKLSQLGPGVGWVDVNGDGKDDLIIGSGKGGQVALYLGDGKGGLKEVKGDGVVEDDTTGIVGWENATGQKSVLVGISGYELENNRGGAVFQYQFSSDGKWQGHSILQLPDNRMVGPLTVGDLEGEGRLSVFVGVRVLAGRYPESSGSMIYKEEGGKLKPDEKWSAALKGLGMVSGAMFGDVDGDGKVDLVVAEEWGPIRVFKNTGTGFEEITDKLGLNKEIGWWAGVQLGDVSGEGRLDIIASNWGLNSAYRASVEKPVGLYYGDFGGRKGLDMVEVEWEGAREVPRKSMQTIEPILPWVREQFVTHKAFGEAGIKEMLGAKLATAKTKQAVELRSVVFQNHNGTFEKKPMAREGQFGPGYGVSVGDVMGEGKPWLFMAQNFYGMRPEDGRLDGGRGEWEEMGGGGTLNTIEGERSGVKVYGEGRGSALGDFDGDGRLDLVVGQNGNQTKLYRNTLGKPGVRVRLKGKPGNSEGVGAVVRFKRNGKVIAQSVSGGGGYWSQESRVLVFGNRGAGELEVTWPGGKKTTRAVTESEMEVVVEEMRK